MPSARRDTTHATKSKSMFVLVKAIGVTKQSALSRNMNIMNAIAGQYLCNGRRIGWLIVRPKASTRNGIYKNTWLSTLITNESVMLVS